MSSEQPFALPEMRAMFSDFQIESVPLPSDIVARLEADQLRAELATLVARYDAGSVSPAIYAVIKQLEVDIAWLENQP